MLSAEAAVDPRVLGHEGRHRQEDGRLLVPHGVLVAGAEVLLAPPPVVQDPGQGVLTAQGHGLALPRLQVLERLGELCGDGWRTTGKETELEKGVGHFGSLKVNVNC